MILKQTDGIPGKITRTSLRNRLRPDLISVPLNCWGIGKFWGLARSRDKNVVAQCSWRRAFNPCALTCELTLLACASAELLCCGQFFATPPGSSVHGVSQERILDPICKTEIETQMYRTDFWTLWEKARVGCFERTASKHVYYQGWNWSPSPGWMHETSARGWCNGKTQRNRV